MARTLTDVLAMFPDTAKQDWKRHKNGGGWVQHTAYADATAYVGPDALVGGSACVSDSAFVGDSALVSGTALVGGSAVVGDSAVVGGGKLTGTALYIGGSRHPVALSSPTEVTIGCHTYTFAEWRKRAKAMARAWKYTPAEMREYLEYVALCEKRARAMKKAGVFVPIPRAEGGE